MYEALTKRAPALTDRQRQVVELIAAGLSNEEIGEQLGISPRTVKAHSDVLRQKLGVSRRRQIPVAYRLLTGVDSGSATGERHQRIDRRTRRSATPHHQAASPDETAGRDDRPNHPARRTRRL